MTSEIAIQSIVLDHRSSKIKKQFEAGVDVVINDVFYIVSDEEISDSILAKIGQLLSNPITESVSINTNSRSFDFDYVYEVSFLPGVTDNLGATAYELITDYDESLRDIKVYSANRVFIKGQVTEDLVKNCMTAMSNTLIQNVALLDANTYHANGFTLKSHINSHDYVPVVARVSLDVSDEALLKLGKYGIPDQNGNPKGPLSLDLPSLKAIQDYFKDRAPTDVELECIAQTWSEHCKHTIFNSPIDEIDDGLFKHYIRRATEEIRASKGDRDHTVSVFHDNAGGIVFDEDYVVTHKVETHNSPSALDPYGGALTGIVGVNRDALGFGLGAKPVINTYGFCTGRPDDDRPLYRDQKGDSKMFTPSRILSGVISGVNEGGNNSGIPTTKGFVYTDDCYRGKPLVFVGTVGLIPKEVGGRVSYEKQALPGDKIMMVGGRVGLDGIHGATFSSEALSTDSPVSAVQVGDPITQKKMSDCIVKAAREQNLYRSITDNGAGGLSCSVAEMARESGGCDVQLDRVPLKYSGLDPWQIWVSESQERMTLAVPEENVEALTTLFAHHGVEATVIGTFTDTGRCVVNYNNERVMDVSLAFLHDGQPVQRLSTKVPVLSNQVTEPKSERLSAYRDDIVQMMGRYNIASTSFISHQFDYEVQGGSVIKPLQGPGLVGGDASVTKPYVSSKGGVVLSDAFFPHYGEVDCFQMAGVAVETTVRHMVAAGASLESIALLDNFCWYSPTDPESLYRLKEAARGCYEFAKAFNTPYISGKDSMFNDFSGYDDKLNPVSISILPSLLISGIGIVDDVLNAVSIDFKHPGDLIYVCGQTFNDMACSEYSRYKNWNGETLPSADSEASNKLFRSFEQANRNGLVKSAKSITTGGLITALIKCGLASKLGVTVSLDDVSTNVQSALFSETPGRMIVSCAPENKAEFESCFDNAIYIGSVVQDTDAKLTAASETVVLPHDELNNTYRSAYTGV